MHLFDLFTPVVGLLASQLERPGSAENGCLSLSWSTLEHPGSTDNGLHADALLAAGL